MSTRITIELPDDVYQRVEQFAHLANRDLSSVVAESIQLLIPAPNNTASPAITALDDEEILGLTELQMEPEQDARLSQLLDLQQAGQLSNPDSSELQTLMQIYQEGLLRKATALNEAVKRGLIQPLSE
ncbi:hypothetical protein [Picosynechococcus sp. PCC 7117]|uniref:hypothetical protein n=1 Tax=Picosynechococcus sp. PCC 7117 TaxID=195498 RepID=UPI00081033DA|nr:hypothetical protein [Picosynechococcus sp. PCC 7117]ANV86962.1 hypothetical protein AWQ22_05490 [Picosynechococcus sp. PCC 7117]